MFVFYNALVTLCLLYLQGRVGPPGLPGIPGLDGDRVRQPFPVAGQLDIVLTLTWLKL